MFFTVSLNLGKLLNSLEIAWVNLISGIHVNRFFHPGQWRTTKNPPPMKCVFTFWRYMFPFAISSPTNMNCLFYHRLKISLKCNLQDEGLTSNFMSHLILLMGWRSLFQREVFKERKREKEAISMSIVCSCFLLCFCMMVILPCF